MKKQGIFAVLFVIALALSAAVFAQSPATTGGGVEGKSMTRGEHRGWHGHRWRGMEGLQFRQLNLTEAQKTALKQVRENHKATSSALREQLGAKQQELRSAAQGGNFNEALATQKLSEMAPLQAKLMAERVAIHQESMNVLTAEQKAQLSQMKADRKAKHAGRVHARE